MTNYNNLVIIHIGKCAGGTVREELNNKNINFKEIHLRKVKYSPTENYVILIRNPIQRFISAFYWRFFRVCDSKVQVNKFLGENELLQKYSLSLEQHKKLKAYCDKFNIMYKIWI